MNGAVHAFSHGLMFHHFHGNAHPEVQGSISAEQFSRVIEFVGRDRILPARVWMERALGGSLRNGDVCITFDDSLRCQFDVAFEVLKAYRLEAFFFVYSSVLEGRLEWLELYRRFRMRKFCDMEEFYKSFYDSVARGDFGEGVDKGLNSSEWKNYLVEYSFYSDGDRRFRYVRDMVLGTDRYHATMQRMIREFEFDVRAEATTLWMDENCIRNLAAAGNLIGLHSHTHPTNLGGMPAEAQKCEYSRNYQFLKRVLGMDPESMSHPCNSYGPDTLRILEAMGIRLGFRDNMKFVAGRSALEFPRVDHADLLSAMGAS